MNRNNTCIWGTENGNKMDDMCKHREEAIFKIVISGNKDIEIYLFGKCIKDEKIYLRLLSQKLLPLNPSFL